VTNFIHSKQVQQIKWWSFPYQFCEGIQREQRYSSPLTSGLDGCQWLNSHPAQFNPGKEPRYPRAGLVILVKKKIFSLLQFEPWTIQMVEETLYTPWHPGSQNITVEQVMMASLYCFTILKAILYALCRRQGGSMRQSGHFGVEKNLFFPLGLEPCTIKRVEQTLYWPCYLGSRNVILEKGMKSRPWPHYPLYRSWEDTRANLDWCKYSFWI
jgi:hypothetical protein